MKSIYLPYLLTVTLCGIFLFNGCDDTVNTSELDNIIIPSSGISFNRHLLPVFELKCNSSGCHNDVDRAGFLSLASWQSATASLDVVFPGEPESSTLVRSIQGLSNTPMPPPNYFPLTRNQIDGIIIWVREGAKNIP